MAQWHSICLACNRSWVCSPDQEEGEEEEGKEEEGEEKSQLELRFTKIVKKGDAPAATHSVCGSLARPAGTTTTMNKYVVERWP